MRPSIALTFLLISLSLSMDLGCATPPERVDPTWRVSEGFIRDSRGRAVIMRGVNLSGAHKSKPYFGFHRAEDFLRVRQAWGLNSVRLLVSWSGLEPKQNSYDLAYLDKLVERVRWAKAAKLMVVLDMHQDVYGEGFGGNGAPRWTCDEKHYKAHEPRSPWFLNYASPQVAACFDDLYQDPKKVASFAAAWRKVAQRMIAEDFSETIVGFDPLNEPHWGSYSVAAFEKDRLAPFYETVVKAVREVAPGWIVFAEPSSSRNLGLRTSLKRLSFDNVVYAPHSYDTAAEQGNGFDPARRDSVIGNIALLAKEAHALNAALWIGEYGGSPEDGGIEAYLEAQYTGAGAVAASTMYWEYNRGGGYDLVDKDGKERANLEQIVRPYPPRVAGNPISYSFDQTASRFELRFTPKGAADRQTEIVIPQRIYPSGVNVDCGGCNVTQQGQRLFLSQPTTSPATIAITPR